MTALVPGRPATANAAAGVRAAIPAGAVDRAAKAADTAVAAPPEQEVGAGAAGVRAARSVAEADKVPKAATAVVVAVRAPLAASAPPKAAVTAADSAAASGAAGVTRLAAAAGTAAASDGRRGARAGTATTAVGMATHAARAVGVSEAAPDGGAKVFVGPPEAAGAGGRRTPGSSRPGAVRADSAAVNGVRSAAALGRVPSVRDAASVGVAGAVDARSGLGDGAAGIPRPTRWLAPRGEASPPHVAFNARIHPTTMRPGTDAAAPPRN